MKRHVRDNYYVVGEGILASGAKGEPCTYRPSTIAALRKFRFSRLGPKGTVASEELSKAVAEAMTANEPPQPDTGGRHPEDPRRVHLPRPVRRP